MTSDNFDRLLAFVRKSDPRNRNKAAAAATEAQPTCDKQHVLVTAKTTAAIDNNSSVSTEPTFRSSGTATATYHLTPTHTQPDETRH